MKNWIAILLGVFALSAQAQTPATPPPSSSWEKIGGNEEMTVYINLASYAPKGNLASIWALEDLAKTAANANRQTYQSVKKLLVVACPERTFSVKYQIVHASTMGKGNIIAEDDHPSPSKPVPPETEMASIYKWVCR